MTHDTTPTPPAGSADDAAPGFRLQMEDVRVRFGPPALDGLTLDLAPGVIHGLLGRNGSGKTTALSLAAGFRRPSAGRVLVDGEDPFENPRVVEGVCFIRENGDMLADEKVVENLDFVATMRPSFDREYAEGLADVFQLDRKAKVKSLSRGQQSAFGAVVGLATRAPLTILDEVYLGMDAPSRYAFYDALLADYVAHPRTFVLSSHLIGELERLLENVAILHRGRLLLADDVTSLRSRGATLTGPFAAVDALVHGAQLTVVARQELGRTSQVTVFGELPAEITAQARALDVEVGPVALQDLFVHLTQGAETGSRPVLAYSTAKGGVAMSPLERAQVRRSLNRLMVVHLFVAACFWGVALVVVAVILALLDRFGTVEVSVLGVGSQVGMWFCFGVGVLVTTQHLPSHVAAGITRRAFVTASLVGALLVGAVYAVTMTVLAQVERAAFDAFDWTYTFPGSQVYSSTDQVLALLGEHLIVYVAGGLCGLLVGLVYYRTGAALGTLALVVTVTPLLFVNGVLRDRGDWFFIPLPDATWTRIGLALLVLAAVTTAYHLAARRVAIAPAMV